MRNLVFALLLAFAVTPAMAADDDKPVQEKVAAETTAEDDQKEYKPPPGYKTRRRGDKTVYCRKSAEIGSRFEVEKCFSEEQLKVELERIETMKENFERSRRVCASTTACAGG